ncbi:MAG: tRNA dihydrouridine synthase [Alphaproteobacteria bacterium]
MPAGLKLDQLCYTPPVPTELRPFFIGSIKIEFPVVLAGLAGYSDLAYRLICRRLGAPFCTTEMMLDKSLLSGRKLQKRLAALTDEDHPVAGQLIGNDPAVMSDAARLVAELGFDVVDLNFACPVNKALRRRRGGYLMSQPAQAVEITRAVLAAVELPVTLKLRRRFRTADGDEHFWRIAEGAFEAGVAAITVHARSVEAKYTGRADRRFLAEVKRRFAGRTIIGSGDMLTPRAVIDAMDQTGVDAVAVARGALGNPWFFRQVRDALAGREPYQPSLAEQRRVLVGHFDHACRLYGPVRGPKIMRKFGIKYARLHPNPRDVRMAFAAVKCPADWHGTVERLYACR